MNFSPRTQRFIPADERIPSDRNATQFNSTDEIAAEEPSGATVRPYWPPVYHIATSHNIQEGPFIEERQELLSTLQEESFSASIGQPSSSLIPVAVEPYFYATSYVLCYYKRH